MKRNDHGASVVYILVVILVVGLLVYLIYNVLNQGAVEKIEYEDRPSAVEEMDVLRTVSLSGYSFVVPDNYTIDERAGVINFRKSEDIAPGVSGFDIGVIESSTSLVDACEQGSLDSSTVVCGTNISFSKRNVGSNVWMEYTSGSVGGVPGGDVYLSVHDGNQILYVLNYGYETDEIDLVVASMK